MDFLDSFDLHTTNEKSNRVRSWYLYEQYKSLEKSQLDAAKKLKHKSYQDRILFRELSERRARRQLSEEFDLRRSDSRIERTLKSDPSRSPYTRSTDSFFESLCEQEDVVKENEDDSCSQHSETTQLYEEIKSSDEKNHSCSESTHSVIENTEIQENIAVSIKDELDIVKKNIAEIINMQIETEKECLEKYAKLYEGNCRNEHLKTKEKCVEKPSGTADKFYPKYDNGLLAMWTKLVAFSYNVMQTNRGNCYYDYSSQFLTGVLAFDVLRKGINRMCYILQPYVSPIKFANDEYDAPSIASIDLNQNCTNYEKSCNIFNHKCCPHRTQKFYEKKYQNFGRKYHSEDTWKCHSKCLIENRMNEKGMRGASEPLRSVARLSGGRNSFKENCSCYRSEKSQTLQSDKCSSHCECWRLKKAINPIIKLSHYIDMILREIED